MPKHMGGLRHLTGLVISPFPLSFDDSITLKEKRSIETEDVISEKAEWKILEYLWIEEEPQARLGETRAMRRKKQSTRRKQ
jgi:hypothetical protein